MKPEIGERYAYDDGLVRRFLSVGNRSFTSRISDVSQLPHDAEAWSKWWRSFLRGAKPEPEDPPIGSVTIVDLFCGCGGLTLGVEEAARAIGLRPFVQCAVDVDAGALAVYSANFAPRHAVQTDVASLVDFKVSGWGAQARFAYRPTALHRDLRKLVGGVDILVAGPPCEGHSNLNNHTRRTDPRNLLYLDAISLGVALGAKAIVVENVPEVVNDRSRVVETAKALLEGSGYSVTSGVLAADRLGLPQTRRRFFLVASQRPLPELDAVGRALAKKQTTVGWAIEDILETADGPEADPIVDAVPDLSAENQRRIEYLFQNDLYDLPDHMRPLCHRNGHTYPSVYGRLRWEEPAGTITTGFVTPGRGRFIHPLRKRPLTPREAARLQGFPAWFQFRANGKPISRKGSLAKWIGDAVPSVLGYAAGLTALSTLVHEHD